MPTNGTTEEIMAVVVQSSAKGLFDETNSTLDVKNSTCETVNKPQKDPLEIVRLSLLSYSANLRTNEAIRFFGSQVRQFHAIVNQKSIQDEHFSILIQVIENLCLSSLHPNLQKHLISIATNKHFLRNILRYMIDNFAPFLDDTANQNFCQRLHNSNMSYCTRESALKHLLTYFTFVEDNIKEPTTTTANFEETFTFLQQLILSSCEINEDHQSTKVIPRSSCLPSRRTGHVPFISRDDLLNCSARRTATESLLGNKFLSILFTEEPSNVIKLVHNRKNELCAVIAIANSMAFNKLNVFIQIIGSKICAPVPVSEHMVETLRKELLLIISTARFLCQLSNYAKSLNKRDRRRQYPEVTAHITSENPLLCCAIEVLENILKYSNFLVMDEIREAIPDRSFKYLDKIIQTARQNLNLVYNTDKILEFSNQNHQRFQQLQTSYEKTASCLNDYLNIKTKSRAPTGSSCSISDSESCCASNASTENIFGIPYLSILITKESDEVIKMVHDRRDELSASISNSIEFNSLNLFIQILGSKICFSVSEHVKQLQHELILLITTTEFLKQLSRYKKNLKRGMKFQVPKKPERDPKNPHSCSSMEVFENVLQYYNFLVTNEIRQGLWKEVINSVHTGCVLLHAMQTTGKVLKFSKNNRKRFTKLKTSFKKTAHSLNVYLSSKNKSKTAKTVRFKKIPSKAQRTEATKSIPRQCDTKSSSSSNTQPVNPNPTADLFTVEHLIQISQMPADQVFNLMYEERIHFKQFITQAKISDDQLNLLISIIGSKFCGKTVFVHFQKYLLSVLLEDVFLKNIFRYTRKRLRHITKQETSPFWSNTEIFESLSTFYNLILIQSEEPPVQLKRNIRFAYVRLSNITLKKKNKLQLLPTSTVTAILSYTEVFKALEDTSANWKKLKLSEATSREHYNPLLPKESTLSPDLFSVADDGTTSNSLESLDKL